MFGTRRLNLNLKRYFRWSYKRCVVSIQQKPIFIFDFSNGYMDFEICFQLFLVYWDVY